MSDLPIRILAILQNQWFKDPNRMKEVLERNFKGDRARFVKSFLFWGCLTGRRLEAAFGEDLCEQIIWENANPLIAGKSSGAFPADAHHIVSILRFHMPSVVLCFGKIALDGVLASLPRYEKLHGCHGFEIVGCCHPAARHATVRDDLAKAADRVQQLIAAAEIF